jgi:hypothetical protein
MRRQYGEAAKIKRTVSSKEPIRLESRLEFTCLKPVFAAIVNGMFEFSVANLHSKFNHYDKGAVEMQGNQHDTHTRAEPETQPAEFLKGSTTEQIKTSARQFTPVMVATATVRRCFCCMVFRRRMCSGARSRRRWHGIILS